MPPYETLANGYCQLFSESYSQYRIFLRKTGYFSKKMTGGGEFFKYFTIALPLIFIYLPHVSSRSDARARKHVSLLV